MFRFLYLRLTNYLRLLDSYFTYNYKKVMRKQCVSYRMKLIFVSSFVIYMCFTQLSLNHMLNIYVLEYFFFLNLEDFQFSIVLLLKFNHFVFQYKDKTKLQQMVLTFKTVDTTQCQCSEKEMHCRHQFLVSRIIFCLIPRTLIYSAAIF